MKAVTQAKCSLCKEPLTDEDLDRPSRHVDTVKHGTVHRTCFEALPKT